MTYLFLYIVGLILIWYVYKVGWLITLKTIISVVVPSFLIVLLNIKAGRLIFRNPILGIVSSIPTAILIFRASKPLVSLVNNFIDEKINDTSNLEDVIETESIPLDE